MLAQPTRRRLFALLGELGGAASTDELAERLALHPNGVRTHLQRMRDAGLVIRRRVARPRGGPATNGRSPHRAARRRPAAGLRALARWLARSDPRDARAPTRGRGHRPRDRAGARPAHPVRPERAIGDVLTALGFQPEIERGPKDDCAADCATAPTATRCARTRTSSAPCTAASRAGCSTGSPPPPRSHASCLTTPTTPAARSTSTASRRHPTNRHRVARSEVVRRVDLANRHEQPLVLGHAL